MQKLSQKWCIVSLLDDVSEGAQFHWKDWPLHVTLAPTFGIGFDSQQIVSLLEEVVKTQNALELKAAEETVWGSPVILLQKTVEIEQLHKQIIDMLEINGAVFNEPQYIGPHYLPHVTVQKGASVEVGRGVMINGISLIDMFPDGDGLQRKVIKTIPLR